MSGEVFTIRVNGREVRTGENKKLIRLLRDDLGYTSVKDGCCEGACGTCTVLMNGRPVRACIMTTRQADGKEIITVEGLSDFEKEAYVYAFGRAGAVQCGFCTPGMVMASKALLDANKNPTEEDVKKAIRGNLCRCTGYKKILEAVLLVAAILRGDEKIDAGLERSDDFRVGTHTFRDDVRAKVLGTGLYPDDIYMENMAHASAVRSAWPRARVLDIDTSAALAVPGVIAVLTAEDVPVNKVGHIQQDWDVFIAKGGVTRCVGDAICLVVGESRDIVEEAKKLVKIEYEPLTPVRNVREAMAPGAP